MGVSCLFSSCLILELHLQGALLMSTVTLSNNGAAVCTSDQCWTVQGWAMTFVLLLCIMCGQAVYQNGYMPECANMFGHVPVGLK